MQRSRVRRLAQIVLNSVAIAFIFELDEVLYAPLVSTTKRAKYEQRQKEAPRASSPLRLGSSGVCALCQTCSPHSVS